MAIDKVAVIGSGQVGETLANGFLRHGYEVLRGTREPGKLAGWSQGAGPRASVGSYADATRSADLVVLAVKGTVAGDAVRACGIEALGDKVVIDVTNPIADDPPENGVIRYFTGPNESLMERLQALAPRARFVKAFSSVGNPLMVNPDFGGETPTMFICGNDPAAKTEVSRILAQFGWEPADMGGAEGARAIEPLAMLWCIPGMLRGEWTHAFRLLKR